MYTNVITLDFIIKSWYLLIIKKKQQERPLIEANTLKHKN